MDGDVDGVVECGGAAADAGKGSDSRHGNRQGANRDKSAVSATLSRRKAPVIEGIAPPPRFRVFSSGELARRFVSSVGSDGVAPSAAFAAIPENSRTLCTWRCPAGHEYQETRVSHNRSRGCPTCATSVATRMPGLVRYWDKTANSVRASDVSAYDRDHYHWICENGHAFSRPPYRVLATGHQCQECRRAGITPWRIAGKRDATLTFSDAYPEIAAEWDYTRNPRGPEEFAPGSQRVAFWLCDNGHSWSSPICHRTSAARHPASCQQCKAIAFSVPELAAELHATLNPPDTALRVRKGSSEVLVWECERGHIFHASVAARLRATYPASCDQCRSIAIKAPDLIAACWAYELNGNLDPQALKTSSAEEAWWVRMDCLDVPVAERKPEHYERKRIGYRYRRYVNNSQREIACLRERQARKDSGAATDATVGEKSPRRGRNFS